MVEKWLASRSMHGTLKPSPEIHRRFGARQAITTLTTTTLWRTTCQYGSDPKSGWISPYRADDNLKTGAVHSLRQSSLRKGLSKREFGLGV